MRKPFGVAPGRLFSYIRAIGHTLTQKLTAAVDVFRVTHESGHRSIQLASRKRTKSRLQLSRLRRSVAEPEPDRQVFAKFKHLLRKAAARSAEASASQSATSSE